LAVRSIRRRYFLFAVRLCALSAFRRRRVRLGPFLVISLWLLVLWAGGFVMFHVSSALIHVLLLLAILFLVGHIVRDTSLN
jgi:hypothetical protein